MWNYVYFQAYLEFKDSTEYNGNESYVSEKLKNYDISWIPIKKFVIYFSFYLIIYLKRTLGIENHDNEDKNKSFLLENLEKNVIYY